MKQNHLMFKLYPSLADKCFKKALLYSIDADIQSMLPLLPQLKKIPFGASMGIRLGLNNWLLQKSGNIGVIRLVAMVHNQHGC